MPVKENTDDNRRAKSERDVPLFSEDICDRLIQNCNKNTLQGQ